MFPAQAHDRLFASITSTTEKLRDLVEGRVPKRTGRLESEITSAVNSYPDRITGVVGIKGVTGNDYAKAGALEYGAHGTSRVRAHVERLGHLFSKLVEPMNVLVSAHDRKVNIQKHDYLRGPLSEIASEALADMEAALQQAADE